ncbi:MAG: Holliday junction resolvase RuvX [Burkholderiaceae bacterium]|nr:Holliday junction resolvase RuvX [Burkholderiaceae bacterium]
MTPSTILAFDFGTRRIGIAIGNTVSAQARALAIVDAEPIARRFDRIASLLAEWGPDRLVVGLALGREGERIEMTARCERFARQLAGRFSLPVTLVDERYSSLAAQAHGARAEDDAEAAAVILRQYLAELPARATQ